MAYLGNAPARSFISFERQVFTIVNSQTAYTLSHSVTNENDIRLVVNNVVQEPGSGKAYTASGTTLTLSAALTNGTDEMYCVFLGRATATNAPGAGSVGTSQLASNAVTSAKITYPLTTFSSTGIDDNADATAITIDSSENVGIGETSPSAQLHVTGSDTTDQVIFENTDTGTGSAPDLVFYRNSSSPADNDILGRMDFRGKNDAGQDVDYFLAYATVTDVSDGTEDAKFQFEAKKAGNQVQILGLSEAEVVINEESADIDFRVESNDNTHAIHVDAANNVVDIAQELHVNTDNSGSEVRSLYVRPYGSTAALYDGFQIGSDSARSYIQTFRQTTSTTSHHLISNTNGVIGSITTNGTSTSFNTSSDHRLKENVNYDFDATLRLKQLKPARFNFIKDADKTLDGFLAHEVQSIIPEAVHGTHNETETKQKVVINSDNLVIAENVEQADWETGKIVDDNGNTKYPTDSTWEATKVVPVYQGIDQAKLVPLLVKTIQELEARITELENA